MAKSLYRVRNSTIHGTGVFAKRKIKAGMLIIEYLGERISEEEANERYDDESMTHHHTFLFAVEDDVVIDAGVEGNDARFINHSCDPNCEAFIDEDRIFIEAIRDIAPDEELTYDYQLERNGDEKKTWNTLYACRCGAKNCRGTMLAPMANGVEK